MSSQPPPYAASSQPTQVSEPPKLGFTNRFINVFFTPSETFADVNRAPKPLLPLIMIIVTGVLFTLIINARIHPDYHQMVINMTDQQLAAKGQTLNDLPQQQRDATEMGMKFQEKFFQYRAFIFPTVFAPIGLVLISLLLWLGTLLLQCKTTFSRVFSVAVWSGLATGVVKGVVNIIFTFVKTVDPTDAEQVLQGGFSANLGLLVPKSTSIVLHAFLEQMDIFMIWTLILTSIGLAAISYKKKTGQVAIIPFGIWGIFVLLRMAVAAIFKA